MEARSGDEVRIAPAPLKAQVVAARQPRLVLLRMEARPDQTRPGQILPNSASYSHCSDDIILSYTLSYTFVLVLVSGHNKHLKTTPGLIDSLSTAPD
jgi:hypothetical protein